jgi:hypothetical protein
MTRIEYRLHAFDLASPFGFADGNMFLLPALPRRIKTVLVGTHNPIRIPDGETIDDIEDFTVGIREDQVLEVAAELASKHD